MTDTSITKYDKNIQTDEDFSDIIFLKEKSSSFTQKLAEVERILTNNDIDFEKFSPLSNHKRINLVDYDIDSDNSEEDAINEGKVEVPTKRNRNFVYNHEYYYDNPETNKKYFDDAENDLINEITSRKRKSDNVIYRSRTKMFKMDATNRRKNRLPKKLETKKLRDRFTNSSFPKWNFTCAEVNTNQRTFEDNEKPNDKFQVITYYCLTYWEET